MWWDWPAPWCQAVLWSAWLVRSTKDVRHAPWQAAFDAAGEFEVVSAVSHLGPASLMRTNLLSDFPLRVRMLGLADGQGGQDWINLRKLSLLHGHVASLPPEKVVFVVDLFDVVWLGCWRDLVQAFRSFGRPLVFGAELTPYPLLNASLRRLPAGYPVLPGAGRGVPAFARRRLQDEGGHSGWRAYRYLNSGCIAGYAGALRLATGRMLANNLENEYVLRTPFARTPSERHEMLVGRDDQIAWHAYLMRHPDEVALDYGAELFLNAFGFGLPDFELRGEEIWSRDFGRAVCFAHGNGATNVAKHLSDARLLGAQPSDCWEEFRTIGTLKLFNLACSHGRGPRRPPAGRPEEPHLGVPPSIASNGSTCGQIACGQ